eukprot:4939754-Amphidinium_carterae.1
MSWKARLQKPKANTGMQTHPIPDQLYRPLLPPQDLISKENTELQKRLQISKSDMPSLAAVAIFPAVLRGRAQTFKSVS